jgi:hypothetical protein
MLNDTDRYVQRAIQGYCDIHKKYPEGVEVSEDLLWQMTQTCFRFPPLPQQDFRFFEIGRDDHPTFDIITVPVVPIGDDVARSFFIRQVDLDPDGAQRCTEFCYGKLQHDLAVKNININTHIIDKTTRKHPFQENQYMCDVYGVAYGYEAILKDLKEIIKG